MSGPREPCRKLSLTMKSDSKRFLHAFVLFLVRNAASRATAATRHLGDAEAHAMTNDREEADRIEKLTAVGGSSLGEKQEEHMQFCTDSSHHWQGNKGKMSPSRIKSTCMIHRPLKKTSCRPKEMLQARLPPHMVHLMMLLLGLLLPQH